MTTDSGAIRYSPGGGVLAVANNVVAFVAPNGRAGEEFCELALASAPEAVLDALTPADLPAGAHVALIQVRDDGLALFTEPGRPPVRARLTRNPGSSVRFAIAPGEHDPYWIAAGVAAASGFELPGYALSIETDGMGPEPHVERSPSPGVRPTRGGAEQDRSPGVVSKPAPSLPTPSPEPASPPPPPAEMPPPPGSSAAPMWPSAEPAEHVDERPRIVVVFDDGHAVHLSRTLAIGRAPEGSDLVPAGAVPMVVSGDQVSRCHLLVRPVDGGAEIIDTNSLNGCFIDDHDRPGAGPQIVVGVPVRIESGQRVRFGDRSLTIEAR